MSNNIEWIDLKLSKKDQQYLDLIKQLKPLHTILTAHKVPSKYVRRTTQQSN